ncbi:MAG: hypothetical protein LV480_09315 [Methylacidiphilales bacterium]|nr:hypothetical protein [Candidatus Methylacidiphilales bacterium]
MAHNFHRHARRSACAGEVRGQRVPQGMEVGTLPRIVEKRNTSGLQIHFKPRHGRHDSGEDSRASGGQFGDMVAHLRDKLRMKGDDGLLVVFRGGSADIDKRLFAFQMKVRPFQRGQLTPTQAGVNSGEIDHFSLSRDAKEALHFIVGEGTAGTYLLSVGLHLLDVLERTAGDTLVLFHPIQKRRNRAEVLVEGLGRKVLLSPPRLERFGGNVLKLLPSAVLHHPTHAVLEFVDVLVIALEGLQVGHVLRQMLQQRGLSGLAYRCGRQNPGRFHLLLAHMLLKALLRDALIRRMQRNLGDLSVAIEPIAAPVKSGHFDLAFNRPLAAVNHANHKSLTICESPAPAFV